MILRTRIFFRGGLVLSARESSALAADPTDDRRDSGDAPPVSPTLSSTLCPSSSPTRLLSSSGSTARGREFGEVDMGCSGSSMDDSAGVSFESRRRLSPSSSPSSSFSSTSAAFSSAFLRAETAEGALELLTPLERDKDLNEAALEGATDGAGVVPPRLCPGPGATGRLRERTLTRMEECMLMLSLLLSASLPGRRCVDGRWWALEYEGGAGVHRSSRDTSMSV